MRETLETSWIIAKREFRAYFATPLAIVFLTIFVALTGAFAFYIGGFFDRGQADLYPFFAFTPGSTSSSFPPSPCDSGGRAQDRDHRTADDFAVSPIEAILGKFFAAWGFIGLALLCTLPMWITVNAWGDPDNE